MTTVVKRPKEKEQQTKTVSKEDKDLDNREIILRELDSLRGPKKTAGAWLMVCCPFHDDSNPSCGVYISLGDSLGRYNCLSCTASGRWNKFAEQAGLQTIKEWKNKNVTDFDSLTDLKTEEALLGDTGITLKKVFADMHCEEAQPWPENVSWRGFTGKTMKMAGAYIIEDSYNDSIAALFPIKILGKVRGGVKAVYAKTDKSQLSYITMRGEWISRYGLFPYHWVKHLRLPFVVLVEGPRDALRLLAYGIPALAVLGAKTWSDRKALLVTALDVDMVYVMPDTDEGGRLMWGRIKRSKSIIESMIPLKKVRLPVSKNPKKKTDPGNMPVETIQAFITILKERHNFVPRATPLVDPEYDFVT